MNSSDEDKKKWFASTVREYEGRLLRFAARKVVLDVAREMVQECFLKMWSETYPTLVNREGPWLFTVTRNLCIDFIRREKKMRKEELDDVVSDEIPVLDRMINTQESSKAVEKLKSLKPSQQEILRLKFQEGFSYKQIAEITGHSVSHVGVLIHEAMQQLRGSLGHGGAQ